MESERVELATSVLVVIDMQNGFVSSKSAPVVPHVVSLVDRWERAGGATLFTRFVNHPNSLYERLINWSRMQTSPEIDLVDAIAPAAQRAVRVLDKSIYSIFTDEGAALVEEHGWTDLVVCGIATESCVLKTACDAFERGLVPWVVTDAVFSHAGQEAHDAGLLVTRRFVGRRQLVNSDVLFADLLDVGPGEPYWASTAS
jgi:nicotinamidase-related amidase